MKNLTQSTESKKYIVWELTIFSSKRKVIRCKWILRRKKFKADGRFDKYNVKLVAKGFT
jgi:hypothetical protein